MTEPLTPLQPDVYRDLVHRALMEDVGPGDITTNATVTPEQTARGVFLVKSACVVAGLDVAMEVFRQVDAATVASFEHHDGDMCRPGEILGTIVGPARALLVAERTALNFLQRLSGIATLARAFVDASGGRITVLDTRKTTPTLRALEKYAVAAGGAANHRVGLYDAVLIKDNHVRLAGGIARAVALTRPLGRPIEVEAQSLAEVDQALDAGVDVVLIDNLGSDDIREAVARARGRARVEISGGVSLPRIPELASTGADSVSVGALTHSAPSADISFEIEPA